MNGIDGVLDHVRHPGLSGFDDSFGECVDPRQVAIPLGIHLHQVANSKSFFFIKNWPLFYFSYKTSKVKSRKRLSRLYIASSLYSVTWIAGPVQS